MLADFSDMTDGHMLLAVVFPLLAVGSFYEAWRGLHGNHRSWVFSQYRFSPAGAFSALNNWLFRAGAGGVLAMVFWAETLLKYTDHPELAEGWLLIWIGALPFLGAVLGNLWWPAFLAPRWYRDWQAAGHKGRTAPYTQRELDAAQKLPDGPEKQRLLQEIQNCKGSPAALRVADQRYGRKA